MNKKNEYYVTGLGALNKVTMEGMSEWEKGEAYKNREVIKRFERMDKWRQYQEILNTLENDYQRYRVYQYVISEITDNYVKKEINGIMSSREWTWKVRRAGKINEAQGRNAIEMKSSAEAKQWKRIASEDDIKVWFPEDYKPKTPEEVIMSLDMKVIGMIDIFMRKIHARKNLIRKHAWTEKGARNSVAPVDKIVERDTYGWDDENRNMLIKLGEDGFREMFMDIVRKRIAQNHENGARTFTKPMDYIRKVEPEFNVLTEAQINELVELDNGI